MLEGFPLLVKWSKRMRTNSQPYLRRWNKDAGRRPTADQLKSIVAHGLARPNTKNQVALAMALRKDGTTQPQIIAVLGQPHRNKFKQVVASRKAKVVTSEDSDGHKVYKLKL